MIDRDNVIGNLEQNIRWIEEIECHQFPGWGNVTMAMRDAVELLKEQETTFERDGHHIRCTHCNSWWCSTDREGNAFPTNYCPECGKAAKWDD